MQQVKPGDTVKVHYHGRLDDGTTFDTSQGREPLQFEVGTGLVIPGFDNGVVGMQLGEKRTIEITSEDAYGPVDPNRVVEFPKANFPEGLNPELGMQLNMTAESGEEIPVIIADIKEEVVVLDANHPLAGQTLIFDVEVIEISNGGPRIITS